MLVSRSTPSLLTALLVAALAGCAGGPIDGTWVVDSLTCDGAAQTLPGTFTLEVNDKAGVFTQQFGASCTARLQETYAYPGNSVFSIQPTSVACDPSSGCGVVFGGQSCSPLPPATDFTYALSGNTLTLTRVAAGLADAPCTPGQTAVFTMTRS